MSKIIGIDLGTTNSAVSVLEGGEAKIIANPEGNRTTPSVVAFKNGEIQVGEVAKRQAVTNPDTIISIKRHMGTDYKVEAGGKSYTPQEISAMILQYIKGFAEDYLGEKVEKAVITVPAYFNDAQRQATKDAGKIAGLDVKRIINEPTAAALAYGMDKKQGDSTVAVYDLGGGTFDVSIIEIADVDGEQQFEVLATNGDTFLGGEDFDSALIDYLVDEFKKDQDVNLKGDSLAMQRLKEAAEKAKIELSSAQSTEVNLPYITADSSGPKHLVVTISRSKLESLTEELVQRTMGPCKTALEDAGLKVGDVDDVILVGGQTRMPLVQQKVQEFFGQEPRKDVNPDEAVAAGAAIQGAVLSGDKTDVLLLDVTPLTLGIETMGGVMTPIIEKNTMIPTKKSQVFSTAEDNQPAVTIQVYQGERKIANQNKQLGRFDLTDIPPAPRGLPQIEVTFDINADGIMNISAKDKGTGKAQSIQIKADSGLSDEEVEQMVRDAEANAAEDEKFANLAQVRNEADGRIHAVQKALKEAGDKVTEDEKSTVETAISELEAAAKEDDHDDIKAKLEALDNAFLPVSQKIYADAGAGAEGMDPSQFQQGADNAGNNNQADDDVVDAEFTEVDEDKK